MNVDINPDEIFVDSENIPQFNNDQFEGRIEKPIGKGTFNILGFFFIIIALVFTSKLWSLQIVNGEEFKDLSENNRLIHTLIFADRGVIYDRNGIPVAWNKPKEDGDFNLRQYREDEGFSNLIGYIKYPKKDSAGFYYEEDFTSVAGVESIFADTLSGENGLRLVETNAHRQRLSDNTINPPVNGESVTLTIDSRLQSNMYKYIKEVSEEVGFEGGGGAMMDIYTGEILALTSYPEYDSNVITEGRDQDKISEYLTDESKPFLNRVISGLYTPGSVVKPYMALGALTEGVIGEYDNILSDGQIEIQNPYDPDVVYVYRDWKIHGYVDVKEAIAYSSNIYFYEVGGGFEDQKGIGIRKIEEYMRKFGFGEPITGEFFSGPVGTIPNPEWKERVFGGEQWRLGDTYFTSIGQYGFQMTPLQALRAVSAIANNGRVIDPKIRIGEPTKLRWEITDIPQKNFDIVKEGMRGGIEYDRGTIKPLDVDYVEIAGKTGTAQVGVNNEKVNSWVTGFYPYENPKYAFVFVLEKGDPENQLGAAVSARRFFDSMRDETPEYLE